MTVHTPVEEQSDALKHLLDAQKRRMQRRQDMARTRAEAAEAQKSGAVPWWEVDTPDNMALVGTTKQLDDAIQEGCAAGKLVVVNFFSPDCYGCKSLQPKLRQLAREREASALFLKVDGSADGLREYCEAQGVTKIPFFHFYRDGARVAELTANMQPEKLRLLRDTLEAHGAGAALR